MGEEVLGNGQGSPSILDDSIEDSRPFTEVAVGLVHRPQAGRVGAFEVLMGQRPAGKPYSGWWEFPGGKIESGESVSEALARELFEELALRTSDSKAWVVRTHSYPHARVRLHFRRIFEWSGEPTSMEGQAFAWQALDRIVLEPLLPAALPLLDMLRWPANVVLFGFKAEPVTLDELLELVDDSILVAGDRLIVRLEACPGGFEVANMIESSQAQLKLIQRRAQAQNLLIYLDEAWHAQCPELAGFWRHQVREGLTYLEVMASETFFELNVVEQALLPRALVLMESTEQGDTPRPLGDKERQYREIAAQVELPLFWPRKDLMELGGHGCAISL